MKLEHIKEGSCPTCHSSIVGERKEKQHTNEQEFCSRLTGLREFLVDGFPWTKKD